MENLFKVTNQENASNLDLFIFDVIDDFWGIGKTDILNQLKNNKFNTINLNISSPGGSVDDGFAIHDLIKGSGAEVTANLSGVVASIATVIALSADKVIMSDNSLFMIHNASVGLQANKEEMAEAIEVMEKFDDRIANVYQKKTGLPIEQIKDLMTAETWLSPEEALELGFIDEISSQGLRLAAKFDLDTIKNQGYKNIPNNITEIINYNNNMEVLKDAFNAFISAFENKGVEVTDEHKALITEVENSIKEQFENSLKEAEVENSELKANLEEANERIENLLNAQDANNDLAERLEVANNTISDLEAKLAVENAVETKATPEADAQVENKETVSYLDSVAKILKSRN